MRKYHIAQKISALIYFTNDYFIGMQAKIQISC